MAFADFAPTGRSVPFPLARVYRAVVRWLAACRAARARKSALQSLLFAPEYRLRDLGITRHELLRAIDGRRK